MDDVERIEPIGGELGKPGSTYRLVPKRGNLIFVARVISRELPDEARLILNAPKMAVSVTARYIALSEKTSRLVSEEDFTFDGLFANVFCAFARVAIQRAHRRQMESFKRFAERQT